MERRFNGKAIYQPTGKAGEYSSWACNFFTGCSNDCQYCYCKRGVMSHVWSSVPRLKKCFKDESHAHKIFVTELERNLDALRTSGLFFSFTTDPMLPETRTLTMLAVKECINRQVPVQILTKCAGFIGDCQLETLKDCHKQYIAIGFTLTCCDELEPNAASNSDRIKEMNQLHNLGYRTFASLEPVIEAPKTVAAISIISGWCDLIKVGLLSGKRNYRKGELEYLYDIMLQNQSCSKFYLKESFISALGIDRNSLPSQFVSSDYNIFSHEVSGSTYNK